MKVIIRILIGAMSIVLVGCAIANWPSETGPQMTTPRAHQSIGIMPKQTGEPITLTVPTTQPEGGIAGILDIFASNSEDDSATTATPSPQNEGTEQVPATTTPEATMAPEPEVHVPQPEVVITNTNGVTITTIVIHPEKMYILEQPGKCADWATPGHVLINNQQNGGFWSLEETFISDGQRVEQVKNRPNNNIITGKWVDEDGNEVNPCEKGT